MSANTKIEWADHTFNPWIGCTAISPGCTNCYASDWAKRYGKDFASRTRTKTWGDPVRWNKQHAAFFAEHGRRQRVFCASLADVFDNAVDPQWRRDLFDLIELTPNLDWLLLTKRIGNVQDMVRKAKSGDWLAGRDNVLLGATIVNQEEADRDIPKLLAVPAAKRFLSMEPLLGPVDLTRLHNAGPLHGPRAFVDGLRGGTWGAVPSTGERLRVTHGPVGGVDWVIVGGESGPGARPMHPDWARSLRDQCEAAGVPFLFKQWGEWLPGQNEIHPESWDGRRVAHHQDGSWGATETKVTSKNYVAWDSSGCIHRGCLIDKPLNFLIDAWAERVGKKASGRLLDGREWNGVPS